MIEVDDSKVIKCSHTFNNCNSYDKSDAFLRRIAIVLTQSILIFNTKNGKLKRQEIKIPTKDLKDYQFGEPIGTVFPIIRNQSKEPIFKSVALSPTFFRTGSDHFQLLAVLTNNFHVLIYKPPSYVNNDFLVVSDWEKVCSISDILFDKIRDKNYNTPIDLIDDKWSSTIVNPVSNKPHPQLNSISNIEYRKLNDWMDTLTISWSPILSPPKDGDGSGNNFVFLVIGGKSNVSFFKLDVPTQDQDYIKEDSINFEFIKSESSFNEDWTTSLKWKPIPYQTDDKYAEQIVYKQKPLSSAILATGSSDGSVKLYTIFNDSSHRLLDSIIKPDSNPVLFLEWSPLNEKNESYLFIGKGIGYYIYYPEIKQLSGFIVNHKSLITSASLPRTSSKHIDLYTASLDSNIVISKIDYDFWKSLDPSTHITKSIKSISTEKGLGLYVIASTPNQLYQFYGENISGGFSMFESKHSTSRIGLSPSKDINNIDEFNINTFIANFLIDFGANRDNQERIWDYYMFISSLKESQMCKVFDSVEQEFLACKSKYLLQLTVRLYWMLVSKYPVCLEKYKDKKVAINQYSVHLELSYISMILQNFLDNYSIQITGGGISGYQKTSILLMCDWISSITDSIDKSLDNNNNNKDKKPPTINLLITNRNSVNHLKDIRDEIFRLFQTNPNDTNREACPYCGGKVLNNVDKVLQCESGCYLNRCSRTYLLMNTYKVYQCNQCKFNNYSYILHGEHDFIHQPLQFSSLEFPWIRDLYPKVTCIYCNSFLEETL
eukprot:gene2467-3050_t